MRGLCLVCTLMLGFLQPPQQHFLQGWLGVWGGGEEIWDFHYSCNSEKRSLYSFPFDVVVIFGLLLKKVEWKVKGGWWDTLAISGLWFWQIERSVPGCPKELVMQGLVSVDIHPWGDMDLPWSPRVHLGTGFWPCRSGGRVALGMVQTSPPVFLTGNNMPEGTNHVLFFSGETSQLKSKILLMGGKSNVPSRFSKHNFPSILFGII